MARHRSRGSRHFFLLFFRLVHFYLSVHSFPVFFNFIFLIVLFPVSSPTCSRALAVTLQRSSRCTFFSARISTFIVSVPQSRFPLSDHQDRLCFNPLILCVRAALKSPLLAATSRSLSAACASPGTDDASLFICVSRSLGAETCM